MFQINKSGESKKTKGKLILKLMEMFAIILLLCTTVSLVKDIFAYFTNYTNEIANNFTISGERQITYNYHLLDDDSILREPQTESVEIGKTITLNSSKIINDERYTFVNFKIGETEYSLNDEFVMPRDNVVVDEYYVNNYSITYELNGGTNNASNPIKYTMLDTINLEPATKDEYTFAGWYENDEFTGDAITTITNKKGNITLYAKWIKAEYKVIVHHYEEGTMDKLSQDVILRSRELGAQYSTSKLSDTGRFYYVSVVGNDVGTFTEEDIEVTYYYRIRTFEITGEAEIGGKIEGKKSNGDIEGIDETVRYGGNATKSILITPDVGNKVKDITINDIKIEGYRENKETKVVMLESLTNITENKRINVTFEPIPMVAKIIKVPEGYENLLNTEYEYLEYAINAVPEAVEGFTIQVIHEIENETNFIDNKYVRIDLNGYEVCTYDDQNANITVRSGALTVINSKEEGRIVNKRGKGIEVFENATFTLGKNDGEVSFVAPVIEGITKGIINFGNFRFFDGIVKGKITIDGLVTDTPELYEPVTPATSNQIKETSLARITDVEAFIGKTRYAKLEQAIEAANNTKGTPEEQIEIDVVTDLTKDAIILIDDTKNIKLDLNGHKITTTAEDYIFENHGKFEVIDSGKKGMVDDVETVDKIGKIESITQGIIINTQNGYVKLTGGTFSTTKNPYVIYGNSNSTTFVEDGATISGLNCIYIEENAELTINGGTISSNGLYYNSCLNINGTKGATINGGNINVNGGAKGICNTGTGEIVINNGTMKFNTTRLFNKLRK